MDELFYPIQRLIVCGLVALCTAWVSLYLSFATSKCGYMAAFPAALLRSTLLFVLVFNMAVWVLM